MHWVSGNDTTHEINAASATAPVPWISSLNMGISSLYLSMNFCALALPKSSNWDKQLNHRSRG